PATSRNMFAARRSRISSWGVGGFSRLSGGILAFLNGFAWALSARPACALGYQTLAVIQEIYSRLPAEFQQASGRPSPGGLLKWACYSTICLRAASVTPSTSPH